MKRACVVAGQTACRRMPQLKSTKFQRLLWLRVFFHLTSIARREFVVFAHGPFEVTKRICVRVNWVCVKIYRLVIQHAPDRCPAGSIAHQMMARLRWWMIWEFPLPFSLWSLGKLLFRISKVRRLWNIGAGSVARERFCKC